MKACVLQGKGKTEIVERPIPEINDDEVLLKMLICGVCSAELPSWKAGESRMNGVLGHEPVGMIERVGKNVQGFVSGDRVTGFCLGSFAQYVKADPAFLTKVPDELDAIEAIGEPMSCMYSAAERTPIKLGDTAAIVGVGFMGLGMLQLMKLKGAGKIIAVGKRPENLENALRFGADVAVLPEDVDEQYLVASGWDIFGKGLPIVIEAAGSQSALLLAGNMTAVSGTLSVVGFHQQPRTLNIDMWNKKSITMVNAHERRKDLQTGMMSTMMTMIKNGQFNVRDMVTHTFSPHEVDKAFQSLDHKPAGYIKGYVDFRNF